MLLLYAFFPLPYSTADGRNTVYNSATLWTWLTCFQSCFIFCECWICAKPSLCVFAVQFQTSVRWSEIILSAESKVHLRDCLGGFFFSHTSAAAINPSNYSVVTAAEFFTASRPQQALRRREEGRGGAEIGKCSWYRHSSYNSPFDPKGSDGCIYVICMLLNPRTSKVTAVNLWNASAWSVLMAAHYIFTIEEFIKCD